MFVSDPSYHPHGGSPLFWFHVASAQQPREGFVDRFKLEKQPFFAAFVNLKKAYDSVQHELLWAALQRVVVHGAMLAAIQSMSNGVTTRMKVLGKARAAGTARDGVRQGLPPAPHYLGCSLTICTPGFC